MFTVWRGPGVARAFSAGTLPAMRVPPRGRFGVDALQECERVLWALRVLIPIPVKHMASLGPWKYPTLHGMLRGHRQITLLELSGIAAMLGTTPWEVVSFAFGGGDLANRCSDAQPDRFSERTARDLAGRFLEEVGRLIVLERIPPSRVMQLLDLSNTPSQTMTRWLRQQSPLVLPRLSQVLRLLNSSLETSARHIIDFERFKKGSLGRPQTGTNLAS